MTDIDKVVSGYLQALEFTECGPDAEQEIRDASFGPEIEAYAESVCRQFLVQLTQDLQDVELQPSTNYARLGMCVWYAQQGHEFGDHKREFTTREGQELGRFLASIVDKLGIPPACVWAESGTLFAE